MDKVTERVMRIIFVISTVIFFMTASMLMLWGFAFLVLGVTMKAVACFIGTATCIALTLICYAMS